MDISKAQCPECSRALQVDRMVCRSCGVAVEGEIEVSALGQLELDEQVFVTAFLRSHGSIRRMESLFGVSYPTVKNRLNRISSQLALVEVVPPTSGPNESPAPDTRSADVLNSLESGEIDVEEAVRRLS